MNRQRSLRGRFMSSKAFVREEKIKLKTRERFENYPSDSSVGSEPKTEDYEVRSNKKEDPPCVTGRHIVELDVLCKELFCSDCSSPLLLQNIQSETRIGLASLLYILCDCGILNRVPTGKSHRSDEAGNRGVPVYDVNTKAAAAMLHSGLGHSHVSNWLAAMNIPPMSDRTMKRREREIGPLIEEVARNSCQESLQEEVKLAQENSTEAHVAPSTQNQPVQLTASYDMGWQRRSTGRMYNSKSGHGCLIGQNTGNIIAYGSRKSTCRICENASKNNVTVAKHDCRYNWSGSAKSMESSLGVELLQETSKPDSCVKYIIMDDDTTTLSHLRQEYDPDIIKWSDINHSQKRLNNQLYKLAKTHRKLTGKVISYLKKCYSYVLNQNKNNVEAVRRGLRSITPHVFGDHTNCRSWCGFLSKGAAYKYSSLPRGQCLEGDQFRDDLKAVFEIHALNADRLAPLGSTKANESFNNVVASKAPKSRHYSSSESLDFRIGAAVSQKNLGPAYLMSVYKNNHISPGQALAKKAKALQRKAAKRKANSLTKSFKRRRVQLAETRCKFTEEHEVREGQTYETCIGSTEEHDVIKIPDPEVIHVSQPMSIKTECKLIMFDLETSSTEWDTDICQVSAVVDETNVFNKYVLPCKPISHFASQVTKLTVHENTLLHKGIPVETVSLPSALKAFIAWMRSFNAPIILVGHNSKAFDSAHLCRVAQSCDLLTELSDVVHGFIDTLPHFRKCYPSLTCHKEEFLVETLLGKQFDAHNALADCLALRELVNLNDTDIFQHSFEMQWAVSHMQSLKRKHENVKSFSAVIRRWSVSHLQCLQTKRMNLDSYRAVVKDKIISQNIAEKCASSGLKLDQLRLAFRRSGEEGVQSVLSEKSQGKTRVTNRKQVVEKLCNYFQE